MTDILLTLDNFDDWPMYLTVTQVARLFRVNDDTVRIWVRRKKLTPVENPEGQYIFPKEAIYQTLLAASS